MHRIEFSEITNRMHRNAMGAAALIISIKLFHLQIDKAGTLGIEIKNFTTGALVVILFAAMVYHVIAFAIRAFEDYRVWQLELTNISAAFYGGGVGIINLTNKIAGASEVLKKIVADAGAITVSGQTIFTKQDADNLNEFSKAAEIYAKRLKNFPLFTRLRFWGWDVGMTFAIVIIATLLAWSLWPSWHQLFCGA